jgi:hypothetical protein
MGLPSRMVLFALAVAVASLVFHSHRGPGTLKKKHPEERQP